MSEPIADLSPAKRALLEERLFRGRGMRTVRAQIPRREGDGPSELSSPQQRLWFLDQLAPDQPTYNAALAMRIRGPLDLARLEQAMRVVIERHEALRTVFRAGPDGKPLQLTLSSWRFDLRRYDLRAEPVGQREAQMLAAARTESRSPFDLARDLMLRASAFSLGTDEYVLLFVEHHIAFDSWSDEQLFDELEECYAAGSENRDPILADLPIQYADWAAWQRDKLDGELLERLERYWRSALAGAPPLLRLPLDHPRPVRQAFAGTHHHFDFPDHLARPVKALAREERATPFMVLVAVFVAMLQRWSGQDDILLGSPIANRDRTELEHLIGLFSNTFVMRVRADAEPTLRELVRRTRDAALGAYEHQSMPFEKLVEVLRPPRDPRYNPIFQVNVRVRSEPPRTLRLPDLTIEPFDLDVGFSRFDLAVEFQLHDDDRVSGYLEYNHALFEEATARWLTGRLARLAADGLTRPDVAIAELDWALSATSGIIRGRRSSLSA